MHQGESGLFQEATWLRISWTWDFSSYLEEKAEAHHEIGGWQKVLLPWEQRHRHIFPHAKKLAHLTNWPISNRRGSTTCCYLNITAHHIQHNPQESNCPMSGSKISEEEQSRLTDFSPLIMKLPVVRYSPVGAVFDTWTGENTNRCQASSVILTHQQYRSKKS